MGTFGSVAFENVTKQRQGPLVRKYQYQECPMLGLLQKKPTWPGKGIEECKVKVSHSGGGGSSFSGAQNNQAVPTYKKFQVPRLDLYHVGSIEHKEAAATMTAEGSPLQLIDESLNDAHESFGQKLAKRVWGDFGNSLAQIESVSTNDLTLKDPRATIFFTIGQVLVASVADGNNPADVLYNGQCTVTKIDRQGGIITVDNAAAINAPTGLAANDWLFYYDSFQQGWNGVPSWIPVTDPGPTDNFLQVNRSIYPTRLAGTRYAATQSLRASLTAFIGQIVQNGGRPDLLLFNSLRHSELIAELDADSEFTINVGGTGADRGPTFAFKAPAIQTQLGLMPIIHDPYAPYRYCWALRRDSWELKSLKEVPHYAKDSDRQILRVKPNADESEYRMRGWGNIICRQPWHNGVCDLDAV